MQLLQYFIIMYSWLIIPYLIFFAYCASIQQCSFNFRSLKKRKSESRKQEKRKCWNHMKRGLGHEGQSWSNQSLSRKKSSLPKKFIRFSKECSLTILALTSLVAYSENESSESGANWSVHPSVVKNPFLGSYVADETVAHMMCLSKT